MYFFFPGSVPHGQVLVNFLISGTSFLNRVETNQQNGIEGLVLPFLKVLMLCRQVSDLETLICFLEKFSLMFGNQGKMIKIVCDKGLLHYQLIRNPPTAKTILYNLSD